jgi:hypothetical protein
LAAFSAGIRAAVAGFGGDLAIVASERIAWFCLFALLFARIEIDNFGRLNRDR